MGAEAPSGAANIVGAIHQNGYLRGAGSARDQYPRRKKRPRDEDVGKAAPKTLYVNRPVLNGSDLIAWAKEQGYPTVVTADDLHVTIAYSRQPVDWGEFEPDKNNLTIPAARPADGERFLACFGPNKDVSVLKFNSPELGARWREFIDGGASWDWPGFQPHITISLKAPAGIEATASPYLGPIVLGPEEFEPIKDGSWKANVVEKGETMDEALLELAKHLGAKAGPDDYIDDFVNSDNPKFKDKSKEERVRMALGAYYAGKSLNYEPSDDLVNAYLEKAGARHNKGDQTLVQTIHDHAVALGAACNGMEKIDRSELKKARVNDELGLVMGYAIVCKVNGQPYYDLNIDSTGERVPEHIPEEAMLKAAAKFMETSRPGNEMHAGPDKGTFLFAFPLTTDVAKAMAIKTPVTGLLVAYKAPPDVLAKFKDGTYRGFSIEGRRVAFEEHE